MFSSNTTQVSDGGYQISRSLRFNSADTTNLNRTFASAGNRRTFTLSFWLKRSRVGVDYEGFFASGNGTDQIRFENIDQLRFSLNSTASGDFVTTQVFRDVSAWYHIVFAVDTTQATSTNRVKIYVNGSQITSFTTSSYPTLNYDCNFNSNVSHRLGIANDTSYPFNGYITETYLIDGQALTPSSFGETNAQTGVWQPKAYSGSYGTNGFYVNFSDNSNTTAATLGKDYSGNGNNWTPNNFSVTAGAGNDSLVDSPTSYGTDTGVGGTVRGNYATINPLSKLNWQSQGGTITPSNGNLQFDVNSAGAMMDCTIAVRSGKWYWEITQATALMNGIRATRGIPTGDFTYRYFQNSGEIVYTPYNSATTQVLTFVASATAGDTIGIALDLDNFTLSWYKNNTLLYTATGIVADEYSPCVGAAGAATGATINFGQRPFAYTAPSGFKALCTQNLPTPTIGATTATLASKYFAPTLYTGNGTSQTITTGFMPNLVWIKSRSNAQSHFLHNNVDNVSLYLSSNNTSAEGYDTTTVTAISSTGFSLGTESNHNGNGNTYVAWGWNASGSSGGTTNTAGSITSTVSANTTSGFSVVTYTGTGNTGTVGHGLGVAPSMIMFKARNNAADWINYVSVLGASNAVFINATNGSTSVTDFASTAPTSTVFTVNGSAARVGSSGWTYVAYCFAEVAGYSKFGSYTGNNSADGPFVYLGFKPKFVLIKDTGTVGNWWIGDGTRSTYNVVAASLLPNLSNAESSAYNECDFLSNGFKWRATDANSFPNNVNGNTYIYMAFAENPFKFSLAR